MLLEIPRVCRTIPIAACIACLGPTSVAAQFRDARLPRQGQLWFEMTPELLNWSEQFAQDSGDDVVDDSGREPLFAHYDGPLAARLFPGPDLFIDGLNADAAAFGFDPVTAADFSLGDMDFSTMRAQVRRLGLGFELGVLDRLSVGFKAPFTLTDVVSSFVFDSTTASVTGAAAAFPAGGQFFVDAQSSLGSLQALIDGGSLTGSALTEAIALRDDTDAFVSSLEQRAMESAFIPTAPSAAGTQMAQRFTDFADAFGALGLTLPELLLPETARQADMAALFNESPLVAFPPRSTRNGLELGEVEVSLRFNLLDQITRRPARAPEVVERALTDPTTGEPADPGAAQPVVIDTSATGSSATGSEDSGDEGIRFRTSLGLLARIPIRPSSFPPFANAANFVDVPIGDGQTDIELALYQDISFDGWFVVRAAARYGIQRADDLILRVAPPDRPYAFQSLQTVVRRDLGDYLVLLIRPSVRINSALSLGLEYDYFRLGDPTYTLTEELADVADATPLAAEGSQTRQRLGVGFILDLSEARGHAELRTGTRSIKRPWQFGISLRRAIGGSGGQTPASFRFGADFRVPIDIF